MTKIKPSLFLERISKLIKVINGKDITYNKEISENELRISLYDKEQSNPIIYGEYRIQVTQIANNLFLGMNISFNRDSSKKKIEELMRLGLEFKAISLKFFYNNEILCKAEWANTEESEDIQHPQPHWHFEKEFGTDVLSETEMYNKGFNAFIEENQDGQNGFEKSLSNPSLPVNQTKFDMRRMHFAICEQWNKKENDRQKIDLNESSLFYWTSACIESVIQEYSFR